jgi:transposase
VIKRVRHSKEFKIEALKLLSLGDRPVTELALELGVKRSLLYRWRDQMSKGGDSSFPGPGRPKNDELSELARLKKENALLREERDILKKAAAYFARDLR